MSDRAALVAAIVAHPEEDTPRLVFADWLDEHDDFPGPAGRASSSGGAGPGTNAARAEFVRLQIEWERAERFSAPWLNLIGRMSALVKGDPREFDAEPVSRLAPVPFRRGFTEAVRFTVGRILDSGWHWFERTPVRVAHLVTTNEPHVMFDELAGEIPVERLTGLEVTAGYSANGVRDLLTAWGERLRGMRAFGLTNGSYTGAQFNAAVGAFAPGQLTALSVAGVRPIYFQSLPLVLWNWPSNLKWLDLSNIEILNRLADELAACKFRRAETVLLSGEAHRYPFLQLRLGDTGLRRVLDAGTFPAMRRLDVSGQDLGPESLRALVNDSSLALEELRFARNRLNTEDEYGVGVTPYNDNAAAIIGALSSLHSPALRLLDLSGMRIADAGAEALLDCADLSNLCVLIVRDCWLSRYAVRALRERFPCVLAGDAEDLTHVPAFFEVWP